MGLDIYPYSLTSALDRVGGQRHALAALLPGNTRYPLYRRLGRPQGRSGGMRKISPTPGFDPRTDQTVVSRYTDWVIPVPIDFYREKGSFKSGHPVVFPPNNYTTSCLHILLCVHHDRCLVDLRAEWSEEDTFSCDVPLLLTKVTLHRTAPHRAPLYPSHPYDCPVPPVRSNSPTPSQVAKVLVSSCA